MRAKKEAEQRKALSCLPIPRSGRDSNPRAVARKLISSQPRYDHFDTAALPVPRSTESILYVNGRLPVPLPDYQREQLTAVPFEQSVGESNPCFRRERAAS